MTDKLMSVISACQKTLRVSPQTPTSFLKERSKELLNGNYVSLKSLIL